MSSPASPPPRKPPTSTEVARAAGVSRTTVSFVLNGVDHQGISEATRERVLAAARDLGYTPHAGARRLAGGRSHTVGVLIPRLKHLYVDVFLAQLVAAVNDRCRAQGLRLLVEACGDEAEASAPSSADRVRALVRGGTVDGLIAFGGDTALNQALLEGPEHGVPVVMIGLDLPGLGSLPCVGSCGMAAAQALVEHLLACGHRRIGFIDYESHAEAPPGVVGEREQGWRAALQTAGLPVPPAWCTRADITAESGHRAMQALLASAGGGAAGGPPLDAVFAGNDTIAFGALRALREAGWRVPQDIALVGFDDIPLAPYAEPPLTTVHTDAVAHGHAAMDLLAMLMGGRQPESTRVELSTRLVVRQSCGGQRLLQPLTG
ncbi:LacI family DNA-binding transcriptional regulator [Sphaerotilus natans]|nr:LacI family DNA-binding transcriptional regulator [Sphaerotilus natans]